MRYHFLLLAFSLLTLSSCSVHFLLADTASDKIVEFEDNYYVAYSQDSTLEFHYDLWSENASIWVSVLNRSDHLIYLRPDSCTLRFDSGTYYFDQFVDWDAYLETILNDSVVTLLDADRYLPLIPGQWKGLLGPRLDIRVRDWKAKATGVPFTRENSPVHIQTRLCFNDAAHPGQMRCEDHDIWVEHLRFLRGKEFHALEDQPDFNTSDKFFLFNMTGSGAASLLGVVVPLLFVL